jgi:hypothetical protein
VNETIRIGYNDRHLVTSPQMISSLGESLLEDRLHLHCMK